MALFTMGGGPKPEQSKTVTPTAAGFTVTPDAGKVLSSVVVNGDTDLVTNNIKSGVNIFGVAGNSNVVDTSAGDATAAQILSGKKAYVDGSLVTGTIPSKSAQTYTPGTSNQTISAGQYLSGAQTIAGDADLVAANIKSGANIFGVAGTYNAFLAGNYQLAISSAVSMSYPSIYTKKKEILINKTGIYRVSFDMKLYNVGSFVYGRVYKNGSAIGIERVQSSTTYTTYTEDISFTAGDYCQLYVKIVEGEGAVAVHVRNFKLGISFNYFTDVPTVTLD